MAAASTLKRRAPHSDHGVNRASMGVGRRSPGQKESEMTLLKRLKEQVGRGSSQMDQ